MKQFEASILLHRTISPSWKVLGFSWPESLPSPLPGQFFTFRPQAIEPGDSGLLRRPLAFAGFDGSLAYALYQVKGSGTKALARTAEGSSLDVIAPLGNSFPLPLNDENAFLLGGGIGIGPMLFLFSHLAKKGKKPGIDMSLILGFRSSEFLPDLSPRRATEKPAGPGAIAGRGSGLLDLSESLAGAIIATDDGSCGIKGTVMDALAPLVGPAGKGHAGKNRFYGCGPLPMLKALDAFARLHGAKAHVSVEQWMACGVGACYGCVLPAREGGYVRVCADGPVFESGEIIWEQ